MEQGKSALETTNGNTKIQLQLTKEKRKMRSEKFRRIYIISTASRHFPRPQRVYFTGGFSKNKRRKQTKRKENKK